MRVVVTGGAGFIGANLCRHLVRRPEVDDVVVVDDLSTGSAANLDGVDGVRLLEGTILDGRLLDRAFEDASAVVHLAARSSVPRSVEHPLAAHTANATGTVEVLEAVRRAGGPHLVVASSSSVYGASPGLPQREGAAAMPVSPYAASKVAAEAYTFAYAACYGLDVLAFRLFNVFGPLQPVRHAYARVVPAFLAAVDEGRPLPVNGDGHQTRDFTYVGTVCEVLTDAVVRRVASDAPVNLAFGARVSVLELVAELEAVVDRRLPVDHLAARQGDVRDTEADGERLRALFPGVRPVPLRDGLRATLEWFRSAADPGRPPAAAAVSRQ